jgi:leucyl-tRNA synthetase
MERYDHKTIEHKWQERWEQEKSFLVNDKAGAEHYYVLDMFPYPSAQGLHVGHPEGMTATDIYSRYLRLKGFNVLHPMGWDAFGLPAENYAIKTGRHPGELTLENIDNFRRQIKSFGFSYDWSREINTADPAYYKWTQWLFLKFYEKGLAYRKKAPVNWCSSCQTVLANEQIVAGECERCHNTVEQRQMAQWFFKITDYAEDLLKGLDDLDWPVNIKEMQKNWIGKSDGAEVEFGIKNQDKKIKIFTTRLDTIFGATYLVLAPEHPLLNELKTQITNWPEVEKYIKKTQGKTELERKTEAKEKTGVKVEGVIAINPANNEEIPIFIADYVLTSYGTGAIMAVPAHDERDWEFANKFKLPICEVVKPSYDRTALILHGTGAHSKKNWYQWLKIELEQRGYRVLVPDLPNSSMPNLAEWLKALEPYIGYLDEHSIIIGHSLGGPTAIQLIQNLQKRIGALILVAPTSAGMEWKPINSTHPSDQASCIRTITEAPVDWKLVRQNIIRVVGLFSSNDPYIPIEAKELYEHNLPGVYRIFKDRGHFSEKTNELNELPEFFNLPCTELFIGNGTLIQSGKFNSLDSEASKVAIAKEIGAELKTQYRLRDWLISRQRYWGAPIPIIYCEQCGELPVSERDLPVELPMDVDFRPTGESPLVRSKSFHNVKCPKCSQPAKRESDTMDTFVDSSWYFLRYIDPQNTKEPFAKTKIKNWLPVNLYVGGAEHAVMHLLYARFFTKVLADLGYLNFFEPFLKLRNQGLILGEDGQKMSKSRGNVINPDEIVDKYGADTLRLYEMFMGPLEDSKPWNTSSIIGLRRFLEKVNNFSNQFLEGNIKLEHPGPEAETAALRARAQTIKRVTDDIENFRFNTAISTLMEFNNVIISKINISHETKVIDLLTLLILLYPFAPHLTSELWEKLNSNKEVIWQQTWPVYDEFSLLVDTIKIVVQVNGKVRAQIECAADAVESEIIKAAHAEAAVAKYLDGKKIQRTVYVPSKLVNFVL